MGKMKHLYCFIRYNKNKRLSLLALFYSAIYRFLILVIPMKILQKSMGEHGEESEKEEEEKAYIYALKINHVVNRVCEQTLWESKCLVRALTAQKLLKKQRIHNTLYLGCKKEDNKLVAHAWLRCGQIYVTGGNGDSYATVAKFRS